MTNPTPLSPAADAVRDAVLATYADDIPKDDNLWALDRASVVAALRAAVDQCKIEWHYHPDYPETESVVVVSDLLAIAAELENGND